MQIIISHVNTDFDALASMIAAKKLYPDAQLVISDRQDGRVSRFLNIYRDTFDFVRDIHVNWEEVKSIILVDVATLSRIGKLPEDFNEENIEFIVYDHHPHHPNNVVPHTGIIEPVGAAVTLLIEEIRAKNIAITEFEATVFGLGLYTDTGNFVYKSTTTRDLQAASYLMENHMNLSIVQRFSEQSLEEAQQILLDHLLASAETYAIDGLEIVVSTYELKKFQGGLALLTHKLLGIKGADVAITVVKMKNHIHIVGRATSNRVSLLPLLKKLGGGGHKHAGSAMVKRGDREAILQIVVEHLDIMLAPAITANEIMSQPVKAITPETTIEEAGQLMYRYGHSGYPIVDGERLVGIITRRDLDKGNHHGLGHAPVKGYMTTNIVTIEPSTTLEEIQKLIIEHNVGRLPVMEEGKMIGIVTRTNIIEMLHNENLPHDMEKELNSLPQNLQVEMEDQLPEDVFTLLKQISETASHLNASVYLIGGIVRDIILQKPNDDIDIVVEGDGIAFAKSLQQYYGGEVREHGSFGTATWTHPSNFVIDITSSRLEYYERPASLPNVELSTLEEDLHRRDFTINAMALRLNEESFGDLIDPFGGREDLKDRKIKVLHNISFIEDPTRIFRAIRFEERFQFRMDEQTEKLALSSIDKVKELTPNRVVEQMRKLFSEGEPSAVIARLFELNFWQQFDIGEQHKTISCWFAEILEKTYQELKEKEQELLDCSEPTWFNYFLLPFFAAQNLTAAEKFVLTKEPIKHLKEVTHLNEFDQWDEIKRIGDFHPIFKDYSVEAILFASLPEPTNQYELVKSYIRARYHLPRYFTGEDLKQWGLKPGPFFANLFLQLEVRQLNGEVTSYEEAKEWIESVHGID